MSLIVAGHFSIAPENLVGLRPAMEAMITTTREEDGCEVFNFAEDVLEPGAIRVFEIWRDRAALDVHAKTPHMAQWIAARAKFGVLERVLFAYESPSRQQL